LPLVTFTEQPMPHPFHQIEGNKGVSLWYASCDWCGALEHDLFLCFHCDPIWVLFLLWLSLGVLSLCSPFARCFVLMKFAKVFIILEEKEKGQKLI
jgi:hypothetical protein